jgi:hypothetical protein
MLACWLRVCPGAFSFMTAWKDEWIGGYSAPTTGPLTSRGPDDPSPR